MDEEELVKEDLETKPGAAFVEVPDFQDYNPNKEQRASGYCDKCHNRYTNAKVVDGVIICPICSKHK